MSNQSNRPTTAQVRNAVADLTAFYAFEFDFSESKNAEAARKAKTFGSFETAMRYMVRDAVLTDLRLHGWTILDDMDVDTWQPPQ